jgi:hypothetical protein
MTREHRQQLIKLGVFTLCPVMCIHATDIVCSFVSGCVSAPLPAMELLDNVYSALETTKQPVSSTKSVRLIVLAVDR